VTPTATVAIVTKNRKDELQTAIRSALAQSASPEVIVVDDGSSDGTSEMVRRQFSPVKLIRYEESQGLIVRRNHAAAAASAPIIFSIDDDAEFTSARTVEQTLAEFDSPRIGAVAIPCIEPKKSNRVFQQAPDASDRWVTDCFIGTSHALRRDVFTKLGGYRARLVHQGEERDYCLRMLAAGLIVRLGSADPIHHYESPKRDFSRMDYYGRRNDVLFAWHYVPRALLLTHLAGTTINALRSAWQAGRAWNMTRGTSAGYADIFRFSSERAPVADSVYRLHRRLKKKSPLTLSSIEADLPRIAC